MTFYDSMICSNNRFSSMPPYLSLSFLAIALALCLIFIWTRRVGIWYQQLGIGAGKALLPRYCWDMRLVYQSRHRFHELVRVVRVQVIAQELGKVFCVLKDTQDIIMHRQGGIIWLLHE